MSVPAIRFSGTPTGPKVSTQMPSLQAPPNGDTLVGEAAAPEPEEARQ